jgi:hypothetical protein
LTCLTVRTQNQDVSATAANAWIIRTAALIFVVFAIATATFGTEEEPTSIPQIANIAGVQIGYSTQQDLETQWGAGKTVIGGHPNSGRIWRVPGANWIIQTDGFEYSTRGLVIDEFSLSAMPGPPRGFPQTKLAKRGFLWLGAIQLGMKKASVLKILQRKQLPFNSKAENIEISQKGCSPLTTEKPWRSWTATLVFKNDLLTALILNAGLQPDAH